jgi:hypothetical protein
MSWSEIKPLFEQLNNQLGACQSLEATAGEKPRHRYGVFDFANGKTSRRNLRSTTATRRA